MSIVQSVVTNYHLLLSIQNYLSFRDISAGFRGVCCLWNSVINKNGDLSLSSQPITDNDLKNILQRFEWKVRSLNISYCKMLTPNSFLEIAKLTYLNSLDLSFCYFFAGADLIHLRKLPLKVLSLGMCTQINSADVKHLIGLPLETLSLRQTSIDNDACVHLRK